MSLRTAFGYMLEWAFFSFLYQRDHLQQVLLTYALILVFEELRSLAVGNDVHGVPVPPWLSGSFRLGGLMEYPWYRVFASVACLVVAFALYAVVNRTRLGMMIRAGASNRDMVRGLGVDIRQLYRIVFAGGVALAALAGMIAAPLSSVYPGMGSSVLIVCFVVVVIGGIGSITGALVASLLVGFVAPATEAAPVDPNLTLIGQLQAAESVEDLKKLWAANQAAFGDKDVKAAYSIRGKALKAAEKAAA